MKIDKTTYKDKEENQIGMTADHTSRPDKVLFFANSHCTHWQVAPADPQTKTCQRVQFYQPSKDNIMNRQEAEMSWSNKTGQKFTNFKISEP